MSGIFEFIIMIQLFIITLVLIEIVETIKKKGNKTMEKYEKKYHASGKTIEQVIPGYAPKLPPKGKTGFIRPDTKGEILDFSKKNIELLEQFPTGWIVVDTINASRFNDDEIKLIIEFNENKGRRVRMAE